MSEMIDNPSVTRNMLAVIFGLCMLWLTYAAAYFADSGEPMFGFPAATCLNGLFTAAVGATFVVWFFSGVMMSQSRLAQACFGVLSALGVGTFFVVFR
jgi:hypothetical protein